MKERPILFNGDMVRAVLDGRKTQTRRVVKIAPHPQAEKVQHFEGRRWDWLRYDGLRLATFECPYGQPGDRLWVRETWAPVTCTGNSFHTADGPGPATTPARAGESEMYCPHTLLTCNRWLYIKISTSGDYNYKRDIPLKEWFQPRRYSVGLLRKPRGGYRININESKSIWG